MRHSYSHDEYSVRKPQRTSFRHNARTAAVAMADFWGAIADSAADAFTTATEGVTQNCDSRESPDYTKIHANRSQAASFAAASRYFEEMASIARQAEATQRSSGVQETQIDYERLAKAIVAEMGKSKDASTSPTPVG